MRETVAPLIGAGLKIPEGDTMIIDFHTHIWPDKMAEKTVHYLEKLGNIPAYLEGTVDNLQQSMKLAGIDYSVVLPVVTKPEQFDTVNQYAAKMNDEEGIISFGGIHPENKQIEEKLRYIKDIGLKGIKIHPDYQGTYIDDIKYQRLIYCALEMGLVVVTHAGLDVGFPDVVRCTPVRAKKLLIDLQLGKEQLHNIVFAHTGGYDRWDDVEEYLVGEPVYFDLSFSLGKIPKEQLLRIIHKHTCGKLLFATDSPWGEQDKMVQYLQELPIKEYKKEAIFGENARKLLGV